MTRPVGILLIAAAAVGYGILYGKTLQKELAVWESFLRLAETIRSRIACFNQPLAEIYRDFSDETLEAAGFLALLRGGVPFSEALLKKKETLGLRPALFMLLLDFGQSLGQSYRADQVRLCERFLTGGNERLAVLKAETPGRVRLAGGV